MGIIPLFDQGEANALFFMEKFSSQEIESQYNLIKMLLAEPGKYKNAIDSIKKDIDYMP